MTDDYLWDRSGPEDPDVARLEQVLGRLRAPEPPPPLAMPARPAEAALRWHDQASHATRRATRERPPMSRFVMPFAVAATLAIVAASVWLSWYPPRESGAWQVSRLGGSPRVSSKPLAEATGQLPVGEWLETDATARARIRVAHIGRVEVEPHTRVGLISTRAGNYRLRLDRGTLTAFIWAPPGQFHVETPSSLAIDLGCAYTLQVKDDGESVLQVTSGWVALQPSNATGAASAPASGDSGSAGTGPGRRWVGADARSSFVRTGMMCAARPGVGPGTPHAMDAPPELQAALRLLDFDRSATPAARAEALDRVLSAARRVDAITLWHLLARTDPADRDARDRLFDRLATFVPPPAGVTRDTVRDGTPELLDRWWDSAKLGPPRRGR